MRRKTYQQIIFIVIAIMFLVQPSGYVHAATCSGSGCNNTDPHVTGCDANVTTLSYAFPSSATVSLRKSNICITYWSRTVNQNAQPRYINATLRYTSTANYYRGTLSPVANGQTVYSNQRYNQYYKACGAASTAEINTPITSPAANCTP
jgi:hypothetical protein